MRPRSRKRWFVAIAGLALAVLLVCAALWRLTHNEFADQIQSIGGRYRSEVVDSRMSALMKVLQWQQPTTFHWIDLEGSEADDAWLAAHRDEIARQSDLCLFLRESRVTTTGLAALDGLENIDYLDLTGTMLEDRSIQTIVSLPRVVQLYIARTGISDSGLAGLSRSPHLVFLGIDRTQATDEGVAGLVTCPKLSGLSVLDADDECVTRLSGFAQIQYLHLQGNQVTGDSLSVLKQMQVLKGLSLYDTAFSEAELAELRQALPNCAVQQLSTSQIEAMREASWE